LKAWKSSPKRIFGMDGVSWLAVGRAFHRIVSPLRVPLGRMAIGVRVQRAYGCGSGCICLLSARARPPGLAVPAVCALRSSRVRHAGGVNAHPREGSYTGRLVCWRRQVRITRSRGCAEGLRVLGDGSQLFCGEWGESGCVDVDVTFRLGSEDRALLERLRG